MQALILVGGLGTRLGEITKNIPKPMIDINGKPFLEYFLMYLKKYGITEVLITKGHLGHIIENHFGDGNKFGLKLIYVPEEQLLGTAGAVKNAEKLLNDNFFLLNGDSISNVNLTELKKFHEKNNAEFTIALLATDREDVEVMSSEESGKINAIYQRGTKESSDYRKKDNLCVNSGVYYVSRSILNHIPREKKVSMENEIFPILINNARFFGMKSNADFLDIGTPERYEFAKKNIDSYLSL